jgi:hypothetical protein
VILQNPVFEPFNPLEDLNEAAEAAISSTFGPFMAALGERVLGDDAPGASDGG